MTDAGFSSEDLQRLRRAIREGVRAGVADSGLALLIRQVRQLYGLLWRRIRRWRTKP